MCCRVKVQTKLIDRYFSRPIPTLWVHSLMAEIALPFAVRFIFVFRFSLFAFRLASRMNSPALVGSLVRSPLSRPHFHSRSRIRAGSRQGMAAPRKEETLPKEFINAERIVLHRTLCSLSHFFSLAGLLLLCVFDLLLLLLARSSPLVCRRRRSPSALAFFGCVCWCIRSERRILATPKIDDRIKMSRMQSLLGIYSFAVSIFRAQFGVGGGRP